MAASFGSNIHSLRALRGLNASTDRLARINERLASGARINRASDDAAGLSVSSLLNSNARVFNQGVKNINDGISALQVADGALDALSTLVLRQRELAAQSANGVFSHRQRLVLNAEANELAKEFNRIVQGTRFNGLNLLESRASYRVQAGFGVEGSIGVDLAEKISRTVGDFTFEDVVTYGNVTRSDGGVVLGDFDNDGDLDVMSTADVTNSSMYFSKNKGTGLLKMVSRYTLAATVRCR